MRKRTGLGLKISRKPSTFRGSPHVSPTPSKLQEINQCLALPRSCSRVLCLVKFHFVFAPCSLVPKALAGQMPARLAAVLFEEAPRLGRWAAPMSGPAAGAEQQETCKA